MNIHNLIFSAFFVLTIAGDIHAASFDCGKAASEVEKIICGDDELSKLDESLSKAYQQALKRTDTKEQINKSQRQWLKVRNACKNAECLKNAYETRIKKLGLLFSDDEHVLVMSKKFAANQARLLMRVLACSLLHMLRQFCLMVEEVKRSMECVIKRLVKVRARISYHASWWYVHVASAFPFAEHYRAARG